MVYVIAAVQGGLYPDPGLTTVGYFFHHLHARYAHHIQVTQSKKPFGPLALNLTKSDRIEHIKVKTSPTTLVCIKKNVLVVCINYFINNVCLVCWG